MKRTVIVIALLFTIFSFSQTLNQEIPYGGNKVMLVGQINKEGLSKAPYNDWFKENYANYLTNDKLINKIKDSLNQYTIKAFLGTWCGDSKKEVPRFYSVLEAANYPIEQLETFALDRSNKAYKQGPNGEEKGMKIHRVPTFIFYKDGAEVNRIVEHPVETFERDIEKIITGKRYHSNYSGANFIQDLLEEKPIDELKKDEKNIVPRLAEIVKGSRELNTLGYVYLFSGRLEKAQYIFELNTKIFPYKHNVYDSLAEYYFETKKYTEALANYYKVLSLKPDDKHVLEMVEKVKQAMK
ncbi:hypothetical protein [Lacinutrix chionoecetis]